GNGMRLLGSFMIAIAFCALASAQEQATVVQGYATTWATRPFIPLLTAPEMSLNQPPLAIGASNATSGLVAGASSAALATENASSELSAGESVPPDEHATHGYNKFEFGSATSQ